MEAFLNNTRAEMKKANVVLLNVFATCNGKYFVITWWSGLHSGFDSKKPHLSQGNTSQGI